MSVIALFLTAGLHAGKHCREARISLRRTKTLPGCVKSQKKTQSFAHERAERADTDRFRRAHRPRARSDRGRARQLLEKTSQAMKRILVTALLLLAGVAGSLALSLHSLLPRAAAGQPDIPPGPESSVTEKTGCDPHARGPQCSPSPGDRQPKSDRPITDRSSQPARGDLH